MVILRFIVRLVSTVGAAFAGNWIGGQIRFLLTGQSVQTIHFVHTTPAGVNLDNYPVTTKFYPALLTALLGKPRWLFAFLGGIYAGMLIPDKYEAIFLERVIVPLIIEKI